MYTTFSDAACTSVINTFTSADGVCQSGYKGPNSATKLVCSVGSPLDSDGGGGGGLSPVTLSLAVGIPGVVVLGVAAAVIVVMYRRRQQKAPDSNGAVALSAV